MSKVIVTANLDGRVVVPTGENFGYIRVEQTTNVFTERGFAVKKTVSALIFGSCDILNSLGWKDGQEVDGKIIIKESLIPFNKKDPSKDFKVAGITNIPCTKGGKNIYRRAVYTTDMSATDQLIAHDNYIPSERTLAQQVLDNQTVEMVDFSSVPSFGEEEEN